MSYHDLSAFHLPDLERMIAGVRRLRGEAGTQERRPITEDLLLQMLPHLGQRTREGATLYAAFCLAFAAFLRKGEFTYISKDRDAADFNQWFLTRRSVRLFEDHLELTLPASKTDPFRRGITLTIAASGDDACPVQAIRHLFRRWKAQLDSPLFETAGGFTRVWRTWPTTSSSWGSKATTQGTPSAEGPQPPPERLGCRTTRSCSWDGGNPTHIAFISTPTQSEFSQHHVGTSVSSLISASAGHGSWPGRHSWSLRALYMTPFGSFGRVSSAGERLMAYIGLQTPS